tara:strand:- start:1078 stop:2637 length:1560 start_codon:yes stop_codon:yes gene_type:complete
MERVIRIQSQQSGNFSGSNNILDFNIPAGQYNMRDSYLELLCSVPQSSTASGILLPVLQYTNPGVAQENDYVPNSKWIKRSRLRSRQHGILEEIQDNDILRQNLLVYTHPALETRDEGHNSGCQILNYNSQRSSLWRDVRTAGSVETSEIDAPINIPLSQICELGKMSNLPVDAMGGAMLNLELNVSEWSARSAVPLHDDAIYAGASFYAGGSIEANASNHSVVDASPLQATTYGTVANPIVLDKTFGDSADFPYYTGQAIIVEATGGTGLGDFTAGGSKKISTINANAGGQYELVVAGGLGTFVSTSGLLGISISGNQIVNPATFSINVITANLVLKQIKQPVRVGGALSYTTWESERFSQTGNTNLQQTFRLPANCMNCLIMFPRSSDGYSKQSTLLDYRLRVNNIDVTNRAVVVGQVGDHNSKSAIHTDLLTAAFRQGSLGLRTLSETLIDANDGEITTQQEGQTSWATGDGDMVMIAFPVNETDSQKFLEVILNSSAADITQIIVYKQVIREVML